MLTFYLNMMAMLYIFGILVYMSNARNIRNNINLFAFFIVCFIVSAFWPITIIYVIKDAIDTKKDIEKLKEAIKRRKGE